MEEEFNTLRLRLRLETLLSEPLAPSEAIRVLLDPELKKISQRLLRMLSKRKLSQEAVRVLLDLELKTSKRLKKELLPEAPQGV